MSTRCIAGRIAVPGTLTRWLREYVEVPTNELVGCTEAEIAEVEAHAGKALPTAYTQMLREAGRAIGRGRVADHFVRCDLLYPYVLETRECAAAVIRGRGGDESLLGRAFPFYNWEVYRICLLDLSQASDDPPVLQLNERTGRADQTSRSFSQFMGREILSLASAIDMLNERSGRTPPPSPVH